MCSKQLLWNQKLRFILPGIINVSVQGYIRIYIHTHTHGTMWNCLLGLSEQRSHWLRSYIWAMEAYPVLWQVRYWAWNEWSLDRHVSVSRRACATFSHMKREGGRRGRVCTVQHVRNVCARNDTWRVKVTFWGRGPCKDNAVGDAETAESVKKMCFSFFLHWCALTLCVSLDDD